MPNPMGRPTLYCPELIDEICTRIANGVSLRTICRDPAMPEVVTVFRWRREYPEFSNRYAQAKDDCADAMIEDILDIADNSTNDYMTRTNKDGDEYDALNMESIHRSKLRVDSRKWIAAKLKPKKYGDALNVGGQADNPLVTESEIRVNVSTEERGLLKQFAAQLAQTQSGIAQDSPDSALDDNDS